jgi:hypothetical protein
MPMSRACNPTTVAELKDRQVLPEHCMYKTLEENDAKLLFESLMQKYPKLIELESMPLPPIDNDKYENWHTKVLRQIRAHNVHTDQVVKAKTTIRENELFETKLAKAKIPKTEPTALHQENLVEFWKKIDSEGVLCIKLGEEIQKRWKAEAEIEAHNKAEAEIEAHNKAQADWAASQQHL